MIDTEFEVVKEQMDKVYTERAELLAWLTKIYPSYMADDKNLEGFGKLVVINSPKGQLSWHISKNDLHLFDHLEINSLHVWDGHNTEEKYKRIQEITVKPFDIKQLYTIWMDWYANGVHNSSNQNILGLLNDLTTMLKAIFDFMGITDGALDYYTPKNK